MDWDEMSERERDCAIAELVMGWDVHSMKGAGKLDPTVDYECSYVIDEPPADCPEEMRSVTGQIVCCRVPDFTTDLSAAWQVVEKADAFILTKAEMDDATFYQAQLAFGEREGVYNYGDSMPDAICHAAYVATRHHQMRELAHEAADENSEAMRRLSEGD